jgi:hypothetical protein
VSKKYPPIRHSVDSGDVSVDASHVRDGYYAAIFQCRECGDEATKELTIPKSRVLPSWQAWAREHYHNP